MRILVARNHFSFTSGGDQKKVETYATSIVRVLREKGHEVFDARKTPAPNYDGVDLALDIDSGRDEKGALHWLGASGKVPVKSAVMFIDTHGYPDLHAALAPKYDHVFFAVWDKRDRFVNHSSAHWCPNFTDSKWFDGLKYGRPGLYAKDFGFFGSKGGLDRTKAMTMLCEQNGWTYDVREIGKNTKNRWPDTPLAMADCRNLFNCSQKHDGPNLRVMESMLMRRPLITDTDAERSGMSKLFVPWKHYIPYKNYITYEGLEDAMKFAMTRRDEAMKIVEEAYTEVYTNHRVENRVNQILEVVNVQS